MKLKIRFAIAAVALASSVAGESLDEIFKRMDKAAPAFVAYTAAMQQTQYTRVVDKLDAPENAIVRLRRDGKDEASGLVRFKGINRRSWVFDKGIVHEYLPNADLENIYDAKKYSGVIRQVVMLGFGMTGAEIKKNYTVSNEGVQTVNGKRATHIVLVPKSKEMLKLRSQFEMWIPEGEANPIRVKATQPNGDYDDFVYSDLKLNPPLKSSEFSWDADEAPGPKTRKINAN